MQTERYRIYAVPLIDSGRYWSSDTKTLFIQAFKTEKARDKFWNEKIIPGTTKRDVIAVTDGPAKKAEYKYTMYNFTGSHPPWQIVSEHRYSNEQLLNGSAEQYCGGQTIIRSTPRGT